MSSSSKALAKVGSFTRKELLILNGLRQVIHNDTMSREAFMRLRTDERRDLDKQCGYPTEIKTSMYREMYERCDVAARVVSLYPDECWGSAPAIWETDDDSVDTDFENGVTTLIEVQNLFHYYNRVDELSGVGRYGGLFYGIDDGRELNAPADMNGKTKRNLLYMRVFDESTMQISKLDTNPRSPRCGQPLLYNCQMMDLTESAEFGSVQDISARKTQEVHWTRIQHVCDNRGNSEIVGRPRMKQVYNRLLDIKKLLAADAEGFYKNGWPGISIESHPGILNPQMKEAELRKQLFNYFNNLDRALALAGASAKTLAPQLTDPDSHFTVQLKALCIALRVPLRVFMGSEEAKLASSQDIKTWNSRLTGRESQYLNPMLIRPSIDRLIALGVLPKPKPRKSQVLPYMIEWPDRNAPTGFDKAKISAMLTDALQKYVSAGCSQIVAPVDFMVEFCGVRRHTAKAIWDAAQKAKKMEIPEAPSKKIAAQRPKPVVKAR